MTFRTSAFALAAFFCVAFSTFYGAMADSLYESGAVQADAFARQMIKEHPDWPTTLVTVDLPDRSKHLIAVTETPDGRIGWDSVLGSFPIKSDPQTDFSEQYQAWKKDGGVHEPVAPSTHIAAAAAVAAAKAMLQTESVQYVVRTKQGSYPVLMWKTVTGEWALFNPVSPA
ncbi:MAG TPA: hypothetical protein PKJ41_18760 [Bryobacteraceae bacterium]|nr:hypothetical protein [Bryobacteraceae bacterium]